MTKLQHWLISTFPNAASKWIHPDVGILVHSKGDVPQLEQCKKESDYRIHLNRKINETCYYDFNHNSALLPIIPYYYFIMICLFTFVFHATF